MLHEAGPFSGVCGQFSCCWIVALFVYVEGLLVAFLLDYFFSYYQQQNLVGCLALCLALSFFNKLFLIIKRKERKIVDIDQRRKLTLNNFSQDKFLSVTKFSLDTFVPRIFKMRYVSLFIHQVLNMSVKIFYVTR